MACTVPPQMACTVPPSMACTVPPSMASTVPPSMRANRPPRKRRTRAPSATIHTPSARMARSSRITMRSTSRRAAASACPRRHPTSQGASLRRFATSTSRGRSTIHAAASFRLREVLVVHRRIRQREVRDQVAVGIEQRMVAEVPFRRTTTERNWHITHAPAWLRTPTRCAAEPLVYGQVVLVGFPTRADHGRAPPRTSARQFVRVYPVCRSRAMSS